MKPAVINITIYQGSTFHMDFQWKTGEPSVPVDLTGFTAKMQIREKLSDAIYIIELSTENGRITIPDPSNGKFSIEISATDTASFSFKNAVYDFEFYEPNQKVIRIFGGSVGLSLEVTR